MTHAALRAPDAAAAERPRLAFISYPPLSRRARSVVDEFAGRAEIEVVEGSFESAVAAALQREHDGTADAFVSAGSNARLLRGALASPVAVIDIDGYDLLLALLQARRWTQRAGVVTYDATIDELDRVKVLLNIEVEQRAYRSPEEARACVAELRALGVGVIVGTSIAVELAQQQGLRGVLAYSTASIRKGIETGIEMARVARLDPSRMFRAGGIARLGRGEPASAPARAARRPRGAAHVRHRFGDLVGRSPALLHAVDTARRYARTELTVLITGETGTGKEMFAQAIHDASARAGRPFVALNCSALPESLLESELFGYDDGAFTGARKGGKPGLFESAHTGTVFLDEIGDMPLALQSRLLRVLQEREVMRLGGVATQTVDVRVIAATNADLAQMIGRRAFRSDLYHRLNTLPLALPPLRARGDDVGLLAGELLQRHLRTLGSALPAAPLLAALQPAWQRYGWPGNVRELDNVCVRIAVLATTSRTIGELPRSRLLEAVPELADRSVAPPHAPVRSAHDVLRECGGSRQRAAALLGISRSTLWRRLRDEAVG